MDDMTPDVSANSAPEPTSSAPSGGQLQAPAPAPAPQQPLQLQPSQPQQAPVTTPATPPTRNQQLHGFVSSVLSGITNSMAGKGPTKYTTDASGKVIADPNQPRESTGDKLRRIGANALTGLAAGAQAGGKKSGLADALSGLGAGAEAQQGKAQQQDDKAKKEARENEEAAQQKILRMHDIAKGNALTASTFQHMIDEDQDRDPSRKQHMDWAKAAEDAGAPVQYMDMDQLNQMRQSDPETIGKYQILPIGMKLVTDPATGQPVVGSDGQPKMVGQVALIDGLHDGQLPAPASFVSDLQKYGKYAGITGEDNLKAGDSVDMSHFIKLANGIQEGKKKELEGWAKPNLVWTGDKHDIPMFQNGNTNELRALPGGAIPNAANKPEDSAAKDSLVKAQTDEAKAKAQEARANAGLAANNMLNSGNATNSLPDYMNAISQLPPQAQALLKSVPPQQQLSLLAVASGDADMNKIFPTRTTAKSGQMDASHATTLVKLLNPDWNEQYYKAVQDETTVMTKGDGHKAMLSFNQFLNHADEARQGSLALSRTNSPWVNRSLNDIRSGGLGDEKVSNLMTDIMAARSEWNTFIHSGHAPTKEEVQAGSVLMSDASSPLQIMGALHEMGKQAVGRLDGVNEGYKTVTHRNWPNLITPMGKKSAQNLGLGDMVAQYGSGGTLRGAMGGSGNGQTPQLSNLHTNGNVTIGWDGKQWVDSKSGQPYQAPAQGAQ